MPKTGKWVALIAGFTFFSHAWAADSARSKIARIRTLQASVEANVSSNPSVRSGVATNAYVCQGRLTTESGVPVSTSDRTAQATLYYTPMNGNGLALYDTGSSTWVNYNFTEISTSLGTLNNDTNYDVFAITFGSGPLLYIASGWSTDFNRTEDVSLFQGVYTMTGDHGARYLGTFHTTSTTTTEDSVSKRYIYNYYNRVPRHMVVTETANSWSYTAPPFYRQANVNTANKVDQVIGFPEQLIRSFSVSLTSTAAASATGLEGGGVGLRADFAIDSQLRGAMGRNTMTQQNVSQYDKYHRSGYSWLSWNDRADDNFTYYGDNGGDDRTQTGMMVLTEN